MRYTYQLNRCCSKCETPITDQNKTGMCRAHWLKRGRKPAKKRYQYIPVPHEQIVEDYRITFKVRKILPEKEYADYRYLRDRRFRAHEALEIIGRKDVLEGL